MMKKLAFLFRCWQDAVGIMKNETIPIRVYFTKRFVRGLLKGITSSTVESKTDPPGNHYCPRCREQQQHCICPIS